MLGLSTTMCFHSSVKGHIYLCHVNTTKIRAFFSSAEHKVVLVMAQASGYQNIIIPKMKYHLENQKKKEKQLMSLLKESFIKAN